MKRRKNLKLLSCVISAAFLFTFSMGMLSGMERFWEEKRQERVEVLEESIRRAAVQCYALEGSYPPNLEYLSEHYGIVVDKERYYYQYDIFASNIMPEIGVYERQR